MLKELLTARTVRLKQPVEDERGNKVQPGQYYISGDVQYEHGRDVMVLASIHGMRTLLSGERAPAHNELARLFIKLDEFLELFEPVD